MVDAQIKVSCIILAGGEGKRAGGEDKGLIQYKNLPLIQHVINRVSLQVDEIIISANRNVDFYNKFSDKVFSDSFESYQGPLAGIATCLKHCSHELVLIVACDMPCLPDNLVLQFSENIADHTVCIATVNNRHQLAFLVNNTHTINIHKRIENNQLKLIDWIESVSHTKLNFDDEADAFLNLNTLTNTDD